MSRRPKRGRYTPKKDRQPPGDQVVSDTARPSAGLGRRIGARGARTVFR